jgi:hypothetical protein
MAWYASCFDFSFVLDASRIHEVRHRAERETGRMRRRHWNHLLVLATVAGAAGALDLTGCGGSGSPTSIGGDGGNEGGSLSDATSDVAAEDASAGGDSATTPDSSGGGDAAPTDGGGGNDSASNDGNATDGNMSLDATDGAVSSCPDGAACSNGGANGVCAGGACVACDNGSTSAGPDTSCTAAYGGGSTPYVCSSGTCIPGNCNSNADCSGATSTCGFTTPNVCGGCTEDSQCTAGDICNLGLGTCVAATTGCSSITATDVQCSVNAGDECCAGSCVPGNCCVAGPPTFCGASTSCKAETTGALGGVCTTCVAVTGTNPVYFVDPVNGSDTTGTGNNSASNGCAFQTITRALQVIGTAANGTTINVVNKAGSGTVTVQGVASGAAGTGQERFPIVLPSNVTLASSGGAILVKVPAAPTHGSTEGIVLAGSPSAIAGGASATLTIDGQSMKATYGVVVASPNATLSALSVQNFAADGIMVNDSKGNASALTISSGVLSTGNGSEGLAVLGTSTAAIAGSTAAPTTFSNNGAHGIFVRGSAGITITGSLGASPPATSTVIASGNAQAGIWIAQTNGTSVKNTLTGVVCTTSSQGNGLRILPGSNVTVRDGWFLGNSASGIDIEDAAGGTDNAIGNIDLGTTASPGGNVVQAPSGGAVNGNAGICLAVGANANVQLTAKGNVFGGTGATAVNCASTSATLRRASDTSLKCANHADVGGNIVAFPNDAGTGNTINVTKCSY